MMHYVHTGEAVVTSIKIDIFLLVTTRPIATQHGLYASQIVLVSWYGHWRALGNQQRNVKLPE